ncbi:glycosyltransferase family 4 protein [Bacillus sp. REN3]|uniref:glycosyltransferase family 4 protein n=1 Tax=Bacillus sp. REN3 TaxID=2802440 RepID=UPI001AEEB523
MIAEAIDHTKKRIIMLTWEYPPHIVGGLARHVQALAAELAEIGQEIHVITANPYNASDYEKKDGVHIHRVTPLNHNDPDFIAWIGGLNLAAANKAMLIAGPAPIDIVHTHDWLTGPAAEYLSEALNVPLVATIHGTEFGRNNGVFTELQHFINSKEKELAESAARVIVCSEFMAEEVTALFGIKKAKVTVIENGASFDIKTKQRANLEEQYPFIKGKKVIFSIGRIVKEKGFDSVIKAAVLLRDTHPDICFVIAGNGPLLDEYRKFAKRLSVDDRVFFIGFIPDEVRLGFLAKSNLAVFPSLYEPFGLAAVESLSFGVPTIVAKTGGMQGLVEDYRTGFYMEPGNEKSLADTVSYIIKNPEKAKKIAESGSEETEINFSWRRNARLTDCLYDDLLRLQYTLKEADNESERSSKNSC